MGALVRVRIEVVSIGVQIIVNFELRSDQGQCRVGLSYRWLVCVPRKPWVDPRPSAAAYVRRWCGEGCRRTWRGWYGRCPPGGGDEVQGRRAEKQWIGEGWQRVKTSERLIYWR